MAGGSVFDLQGKVTLDTSDVSKKLNKIGPAMKKGLANAAKISAVALGAASAAIIKLVKDTVSAYAEFEQLEGGAKKIFDKMDYSVIAKDAQEAYKTMNLSASEYLAMINQVGATFAATLGDKKGYKAAKEGMQAIADYASGTGRSVTELNDKFALITRSTSSYQSIADQFSGILPATSKDFLKQAQKAGFLSKKYKDLTKVPLAEYQKAVSKMLKKGVKDMGLAGNTAAESEKTITGSLAATKAAWKDMLVAFGSGSEKDIRKAMNKLLKSAKNLVKNVMPVVKNALKGIAQFIEEIGPEIVEYLPTLIKSILPDLVKAAISLIKALIKSLPAIIKALYEALKETIGKMLDDLSAWLHNNFPTLGDIFDKFRDTVKAAFQAIADFWKNTLKPAFQDIWNTIQPIVSAIGEFISTTWTGTIQPALKAIKDYCQNTLAPAVKEAWETYMKPAIDTVKDAIDKAKDAFDRIKTALEPIAGKFDDIKTAIDNYVTSGQLGEDITNAVKKAIQFLANALSRVATWIANVISAIADIITWFSQFEDAGTALKTALLIAWNSIKMGIIRRANDVKTRVSTAWETMKSNIATAVDNIKTDAETKWENIKTGITAKVDSIRSSLIIKFNLLKLSIKRTWDKIKTTLTKPIEDAKDAISRLVDDIKGFFKGEFKINIKLPKITTKKILGGAMEVPVLDWNKKAYFNPYMFTKPTVMSGFGDGPGGEIVYGHSALMRDIKNAVGGGVSSAEVTINVYPQPNQSPSEIAQMVQKEFIRWDRQRRAAFA